MDHGPLTVGRRCPMEASSPLFLLGKPDLTDPQYVAAVSAFFGVNWRNTAFLLLSFVVLAFLAYRALAWGTRGFAGWHDMTAVGWGVAGLITLAALLPLWAMAVEEGPRLAYRRPPADYAGMQAVPGVVTGRGWSIGTGVSLGKRRLHWRTERPELDGVTPFLPEGVVRLVADGAAVWIAVDPAGVKPPLFLGIAYR